MKVERGFDVLQRAVRDGMLKPSGSSERKGEVGLEEIAVVCCLEPMDRTKVEWREGRDELKVWFEQWMERESYGASKWDVEWERRKEDS